ncbi:MAG: hypothetical protein EBR86_12750 [Planctomycetia bacterium]|nr:hypothetical protein [Planctomycetia bacterium]
MAAASAQIGIRELTVITIPAAGSGHGTFFGTGGRTTTKSEATVGNAIDVGAVALELTARDIAFAGLATDPVTGQKRPRL